MNQIEWIAKARYRGFREIVVSHVGDGWLVSGRGDSGQPGESLPSRRGHNRLFQSLDTVLRFLGEAGIDEFRVLVPGQDLLG